MKPRWAMRVKVVFEWLRTLFVRRRDAMSPNATVHGAQGTDEHVPQVTRDDVRRVIERDFGGNNTKSILRILDRYGRKEWHPERNRVHLAILKLSQGNRTKIKQYVETACVDFRDVVAPAEYPRFYEVGLVGVSQMEPTETEQLKKDDWDQYQEWLPSE